MDPGKKDHSPGEKQPRRSLNYCCFFVRGAFFVKNHNRRRVRAPSRFGMLPARFGLGLENRQDERSFSAYDPVAIVMSSGRPAGFWQRDRFLISSNSSTSTVVERREPKVREKSCTSVKGRTNVIFFFYYYLKIIIKPSTQV